MLGVPRWLDVNSGVHVKVQARRGELVRFGGRIDQGEGAASAQISAPSVRNVKKPMKTRTEPFQKHRVYTVVLGYGTQ